MSIEIIPDNGHRLQRDGFPMLVKKQATTEMPAERLLQLRGLERGKEERGRS